jgi:2,4-dienoyl-CoA reductase (NADPH2)
MVTGGVAPNRAGWTKPFAGKLSNRFEVWQHRFVTDAVHEAGGRVALQILHTGRYGYHPLAVAPSAIRSPISPVRPRALSPAGIRSTIADFARCAALAQRAGYDGVEVMGSEGYLINQFIAAHTNRREDAWGGTYSHRMRFPIEVVRAVRAATGPEFILIYRLSMLDLVRGGSSWDEVVELAQRIEEAGASIINTGIGWHEARIPTIATMVPRAAFTWVTHRLMGQVGIPLVTSNRINMPEVAETALRDGHADLVSMARPFLADPDWVVKAAQGREDEINTCIACNQACLDHIFRGRRCSCLVNPLACRETEWTIEPAGRRRRVAVIGAGPAGLAAATTAAGRGHEVTLYESAREIGGQFNMAKRVPGKEEFVETLRYFGRQIELSGVRLVLERLVRADDLLAEGFDAVVLATGVHPRRMELPGADHPKVLSYVDVLAGGREVGQRVAIVGAGGIGFDVAEFLLHGPSDGFPDRDRYLSQWGIDPELRERGGLVSEEGPTPRREITMCQRSSGRLGTRLGKTTGWIHRKTLRKNKVRMLSSCEYLRVDDEGLHLRVVGESRLLEVDHVVVCAGQVPRCELQEALLAAGVETHLVGGAERAAELDAKRAIEQGTRVGATL